MASEKTQQEIPSTVQLPSVESNPLAGRLRDIQYYCKNRRIGQYQNFSDWNVYTIMINRDTKIPYVIGVTVPPGSLIVVSKDQNRKFGAAYRVRCNFASVNNIFIAHDISRGYMKMVPDAIPATNTIIRSGDEMNFRDSFDINPTNITGNGLYVHPSASETLRALQFRIARDIYGEDGCSVLIHESDKEPIPLAGTFNDNANYLPQYYEKLS